MVVIKSLLAASYLAEQGEDQDANYTDEELAKWCASAEYVEMSTTKFRTIYEPDQDDNAT